MARFEVLKPRNWDEFIVEATSLIDRTNGERVGKRPHYVSIPLFRGMADSKWGLKTTLERSGGREFDARKYDQRIKSNLPLVRSMVKELGGLGLEGKGSMPELRGSEAQAKRLEYMVYLRHHGYPSPLLDWTRSPYIASFFAYRHQSEAAEVAIFAYREYRGYGKGGFPEGPAGMIDTIGPTLQAHRRHFLQQCEYTYCVRESKDKFTYIPHKMAFQSSEPRQDELIQFVLPSSEREKVLSRLDLMNINAGSLFETQDALMEAIANREFTFPPGRQLKEEEKESDTAFRRHARSNPDHPSL